MTKACSIVLVALLASACGVDAPTTAPTKLPAHGTPATIELSATPTIGAHGGQATVTARVLDAYALLLPDVDVTFSADAGTLDAASVKTNQNGVATTTLTADPGTVKVHAAAGAVQAPEATVAIQPVNVFVPPPVEPPPPIPPSPPIPAPTPPSPAYAVTITASPTSVVTGAPVTLSATVTPMFGAPATVTSWSWDCDTTTASMDATTANTATCSYTAAGTFTAMLRVANGTATGTAIATVTVTAIPIPTVTVNCAQPTPALLTENCNLSVALNGATVATSDITHADWDWADGTPVSSVNNSPLASHTYLAANKYLIVVRNVTVNGTTAKGSGSAPVDVKP